MDCFDFALRSLSPVIGSCLLAATTLCGCNAVKELAVKAPEPCTVQDYSPAEIFKQASPSIVVIKAGESQGSGFVVKQDKRYTYILTNSHVVARADEVSIKWADDREEKAKVISDHGGEPLQKDLALLKVDAIRGKPLVLKEKPPAIGADVVVIGAPQGLEFSLTRGVLSQVRRNGDFLQIDAPVNPGNSGGPLLDRSGCVIGVVTFKGDRSEGLSFAIAYEPTKHFLDNPSIERNKIAERATTRTKVKVAYQPPIFNFPTQLNIPKPQGQGWSFDFAKCSPIKKKAYSPMERCLNEKDVSEKWAINLIKSNDVKEIKFFWIRYEGRRGNYAHWTSTTSTRRVSYNGTVSNNVSDWKFRAVVDCEKWTWGNIEDMELTPIVPNSNGEFTAARACKKGKMVEANEASENTTPSRERQGARGEQACDDKVDALFYEKYPWMKGRKITDPDSKLAKEWSEIKDRICG